MGLYEHANGRVSRAIIRWVLHRTYMVRVIPRHLLEAEELLEEVGSWSKEEVESLPLLYQEKAREYRRLVNGGDG